MGEEHSAAKGVFILSVAGMVAKFISVFYTPFLVGILKDDGYAIYSQTTEIFLFIYAITCMGAQPAVAKVVSELSALGNEEGAKKALRISRKFYMMLGGGLGILMMILAIPLCNLFGISDAAYGVMALGPCVLITCILSAYRGYMQGKGHMTQIAISQVIEQLLNVILSLLCAYILVQVSTAAGNAGAQVGTSVGALFAMLYLVYSLDKKYSKEEEEIESLTNVRKVSEKKILRKIIMYSIPITLSTGMQNFGGLVDMVNVNSRLAVAGFEKEIANSLYGQLGKYKTLLSVPLVIITSIGTTTLPAIARSMVLNERKEVKRKIAYAFKMAFSIAIPAAVGLSMLSELVYATLYNRTDGHKLMMIGAFILILYTTTQIQAVIMQSINKLYFILGTFMLGIVTKIIVNYIFVGIPGINIYGVLIGNVFWHLIPAVLNHKKLCKIMKMRLSIPKLVIKPAIASIVMAGVIYLLKLPLKYVFEVISLSRVTAAPITIIIVAIGGIVYLYLMIAMGGIRKSDIQTISPKLIRMMPRFMRRKLR